MNVIKTTRQSIRIGNKAGHPTAYWFFQMNWMLHFFYTMLFGVVFAIQTHAFVVPANTCVTLSMNQRRTVVSFLPPKPRQYHPSQSVSLSLDGTSSKTNNDVDMNVYNLPTLQDIVQEWSAVVLPGTALRETGIYLEPRNKEELYADSVQCQFARSQNGGGFGLELLEVAGGREDGVGITIVQNVIDGGAADGSGILVGDSIVQIELKRSTSRSEDTTTISTTFMPMNVEETTESFAVNLECLGYDKTIEALQSLPPPLENTDNAERIQETVLVTVKRIRRRPKVKINLQYPPAMGEDDISFELFAGENLRRAMLVRGIKLNDALAARFDSGGSGNCGADGTCATCAVAVTQGMDLLSPPGKQEIQIFQKHPRWRMSCKTIVGANMREGELTIRVSPRQWSS